MDKGVPDNEDIMSKLDFPANKSEQKWSVTARRSALPSFSARKHFA
jgi:hypothetical protein